jgi:cell division protein ZapA
MNKVIVKINGIEYPMVGEKTKEHMRAVAHYVDEEMEKITKANPRLSTSMTAILTALNITDILFECSSENEELNKKYAKVMEENKKPNQEIQVELEKIKIELEQSKIEIVKKDNEVDMLKKEIEKEKEIAIKATEECNKHKNEYEESENRIKVAEDLASSFQNKLYDLQLKVIELEQELKSHKAKNAE